MKKYIGFSLTAIMGLGLAASTLAQSPEMPRLHLEINPAGRLLVRGAVVTSVATSTVNASLTWPNGAKVDWIVNFDNSTERINRFGIRDQAAMFETGHVISFSGELTGGSGSALTAMAQVLKNWSVEKRKINPFGIIQSINSAAKTFVFKTEERGSPTVFVSSATEIIKNKATTTFEALRVGDRAHVRGLWDRAANTIQAERIKIFVENRRVFENGRLKSVSATSTPASIVVTFHNFDYTVNIEVDTAVVNNRWEPASLSAFKAGDHIRVYGVADGVTIEATVVRNISIKP